MTVSVPDVFAPGGLWLDESLQVARWLEADGTLDALGLTAGSSLLNLDDASYAGPVRALAERSWQAVRQRAVPPGINEQGDGLDFATSRPPFHIFAELLGEAVGRGLFFGIIPGVLAMAFGSPRYALTGYLYLVPGGLVFMATMSGMVRVPVTGLPHVSWRRIALIVASTMVPVAFIWLATPVQHWAGIRPSGTAKTLTSVAIVLFTVGVTGYANRIFAASRVSGPAGDQAQLRWLDTRIGYFQRLLGSRWMWPLTPRTVYRALGHDLLARFRCLGGAQAADLRAAVACFREAARQTAPGAAGEAGALHDLTYALFSLAALEMCDDEIDEAIALTDAISARWSGRLGELERDFVIMERHYLVLAKYIDRGRYQPGSLGPDDLMAIRHTIEELTRMTTPGRPVWMRAQILLFVANFYVFFGRRPAGVTEALDWLDRGLEAAVGTQSLTEDPWLAAEARAVIAQAAARRYRLRSRLPVPPPGYEDDHRKALAYIASALDDPNLSRRRPSEPYPVGLGRVLVAVALCLDVELGQRRWQAAYQLGRHALNAVSLTITQAVLRADIEDVASAMAGLHHQLGYATAMLAAGDTDAAGRRAALLHTIDLFEHGRAVLQHAELSLTDFEDQARWLAGAGHGRLAALVTDLAARARAVHAMQLDVHDVAGKAARSLSIGPSGIPLRDEIRAQQAEFAELEGRIAELAGAADPAAALEATLTAAVAGGPLCYLTHLPVGDDGRGPDLPGLAVIVSASSSAGPVTITTVTLPRMTGPAVRRWLTRWPPDPEAPSAAGARALLGELGADVMTPLLEAAGYPSRLVLLPDGLLSVLPLHAAETGTGPVIAGHVVSYAPSAKILAACLGRAARLAEHDRDGLPQRFLGFAYPGDLPGLPHTQHEVSTAATFFPERTFLSGNQASAPAVRSALLDGDGAGSASVVHFACHARAVPADPLSSYLALAPSAGPDRLRLADLLGLGLREIRLAVLSACQTGQRGSRDPDQYVSLATGFLQIGAAGVIGTTTEVADKAAQVLISRFYENWQARPADPAGALAAAQAWLAARGRAPGAWAPFFYAGA
jgi:hypothetical protein